MVEMVAVNLEITGLLALLLNVIHHQ